jgi:tripartite-type tricarboxylate transporter receptor subunit TctC
MTSVPMRRREAVLGIAACLTTAASQAQSGQPLRIVVPFSAGGTADVLPRLVAEKIRSAYAGGVIIENKPGAGGNIGADTVFRAPPDGLTVLASPPGPIAINHNLYRKLAFDPTRWVPVTVLATVPNALVIQPRLPARSLGEFIAYAKAHPGKVTVATQGDGSTSHLTAAMFMQLTGTELTVVPYKGTAPALVDLIGGNVDAFFDNISSSMTYHQAGKLRILAVADEQRAPALPQVPTFAEQQWPAMQAVTFFSVVAPPDTGAAIAQRLQQQMAQALAADDLRRHFSEQGAVPCGWDTARTGQFIRQETEKWKKVLKAANVML